MIVVIKGRWLKQTLIALSALVADIENTKWSIWAN